MTLPLVLSAFAFTRILWVAAIGAYGLLLLKLWHEGLCGRYPFFCSYLAFRLIRSIALFALPFGTNAYGFLWAGSAPISWVLYILVVLELYSLVLSNYKGIATFGRWVLMAALGISILISASTLVADLSNPAERFRTFLIFNAIERGIDSSLAIFLLLITAFLLWYPVPLSRNIVLHAIVFSVYFLSGTMGLLVRNLTGTEVLDAVNMVLMAITLLCLSLWILLLNRKGESKTTVLRQHWRLEDEEQLVQHLDAINSTLLRAARK